MIKAQALADFIAEFKHATEPEAIPPDVKVLEELNPDEDLAKWKLFMNRASNQHGYGAGFVLQTPSGKKMEYAICIGFKATNNEFKYKAFLVGLIVATEVEVESLDAFSDS